jgi:Type IV secretion system pilin
MIRNAKIFILGLAVMLVLGFAFSGTAGAAGASGSAKNDVCEGITSAGGSCTSNGSALTGIFELIINIISVIGGFAAVVMIMIGGFRYVTSGGDSSKVSSAKSSIIYAIVGLLVIVFAQVIVRYVVKQAT